MEDIKYSIKETIPIASVVDEQIEYRITSSSKLVNILVERINNCIEKSIKNKMTYFTIEIDDTDLIIFKKLIKNEYIIVETYIFFNRINYNKYNNIHGFTCSPKNI